MSSGIARPNPHQIQAFAHTVREGSVSAAARKLGVTQGAISQHLKKLERVSGAQLFFHTRDGVQLTRTGEQIYALADDFLAAEQLIAEKLLDLSLLRSGTLSVIANAPQPAMSIIARFSADLPDVQIDFALVDWTTAMRMLDDRLVDVGIVTAPRRNAAFVSAEIAETRYVLYMRTDHPKAVQSSVSLAELIGERIILPEKGSLTQRVISRALETHGLRLAHVTTMRTFPLIKDAIQLGIGVGPFLENSTTERDGLIAIPIVELDEVYPISV
ncbi:MAG: LysR family transcriptional regulator, partial [Pseudomonadota bacterium]